MNFNKEIFFNNFRTFYKQKTGKSKLTQTTVEAVNFLLDEFATEPLWNDVKDVAYAFATIAHETAWTFKPIKEYRGKKLSAHQQRYWPSGYYGRGYVQLTWDYNYKKAGQKLGVNLLRTPDLALEPSIAFKILTYGMHEGWFTGKKLGDYINSSKTDYAGARKIINGVDKKDLIAGYARSFENMLLASIEEEDSFQPLVKRTSEVTPTEGEELPDNFGAEESEVEQPLSEEPTVEEQKQEIVQTTQDVINAPTPKDEPVVQVPQVVPEVTPEQGTPGLSATASTAWTWVTANLAAVAAFFAGIQKEIIIGLVVIGVIVGVVYFWRRFSFANETQERLSKEREAERQRAHELQVLTLKAAMEKNLNTVAIVPQPLTELKKEPEPVKVGFFAKLTGK